MARPRKQQDPGVDTGDTTATPTGTVQARRRAKRAADKQAREQRDRIAAETTAAIKATEKRIATKPTDSRTLVDPDPSA